MPVQALALVAAAKVKAVATATPRKSMEVRLIGFIGGSVGRALRDAAGEPIR
jgi:hypothetical protein